MKNGNQVQLRAPFLKMLKKVNINHVALSGQFENWYYFGLWNSALGRLRTSPAGPPGGVHLLHNNVLMCEYSCELRMLLLTIDRGRSDGGGDV